MGILISKIWNNLISKKEVRILMLGLDSSGKSTILYQLKMGETLKTMPTIGFNVETLDYKGLIFTVWDVGGQERIRILWKYYYKNTDGIIFVIDSNDKERIEEAAYELNKLLSEEDLKDSVLLVFANKQDLLESFNPYQITRYLGLDKTKRKWLVQGASAITGQGLKEGFDWLASVLLKKNKK
jgi:small GTP-binding protein